MVVPSQTIRQVGAEHAGHTENGSAVIVPNRCSQFLGALAEDAERSGRRRDVILAVLRQLGWADTEALAKGRFRLQVIHIPEGYLRCGDAPKDLLTGRPSPFACAGSGSI
jgi:hypothetical protein